MPGAHRQSDTRECGATNQTLQTTVRVNGSPWTIEGQENTHGAGQLVSVVGSTVRIGGVKVIVLGDEAVTDDALHVPPEPYPATASGDVSAYG